MLDDLRLHNMHGPTVFGGSSWDDLPRLLIEQARLNNSNAGRYRLIATISGQTFELTEVSL